MKFFSQVFSGLTLAIAAASLSTLALPVAAQLTSPTSSADPSEGLGTTDDSSNIFSNDSSSGMNSVLDLIHRAQLGGGPSPEEFRENSRRTLESDREAFFRQQQERLQQEQTPPTPPTTPSP